MVVGVVKCSACSASTLTIRIRIPVSLQFIVRKVRKRKRGREWPITKRYVVHFLFNTLLVPFQKVFFIPTSYRFLHLGETFISLSLENHLLIKKRNLSFNWQLQMICLLNWFYIEANYSLFRWRGLRCTSVFPQPKSFRN